MDNSSRVLEPFLTFSACGSRISIPSPPSCVLATGQPSCTSNLPLSHLLIRRPAIGFGADFKSVTFHAVSLDFIIFMGPILRYQGLELGHIL